MLYGEILAVYCTNPQECMDKLCGQISESLVLSLVVQIITTRP